MNPRVILLENLRQSCIYHEYKSEDLDMYWNYMINFAESCADPNNPLFTEFCAYEMMKFTGVDTSRIMICMQNQINGILNFLMPIYS